jgi:hypothetical protein
VSIRGFDSPKQKGLGLVNARLLGAGLSIETTDGQVCGLSKRDFQIFIFFAGLFVKEVFLA